MNVDGLPILPVTSITYPLFNNGSGRLGRKAFVFRSPVSYDPWNVARRCTALRSCSRSEPGEVFSGFFCSQKYPHITPQGAFKTKFIVLICARILFTIVRMCFACDPNVPDSRGVGERRRGLGRYTLCKAQLAPLLAGPGRT